MEYKKESDNCIECLLLMKLKHHERVQGVYDVLISLLLLLLSDLLDRNGQTTIHSLLRCSSSTIHITLPPSLYLSLVGIVCTTYLMR